jgi:hypothetical protein
MTIEVEQLEDNSFEISWDEKDPQESMMNTWTEEDFLKVIQEYLTKLGMENNDQKNT